MFLLIEMILSLIAFPVNKKNKKTASALYFYSMVSFDHVSFTETIALKISDGFS